MKLNKIESPLVIGNDNIKLITIFKSNEIINLYKTLDIDVSRFFSVPEVKLYKCKHSGYKFYYPFSIFGDAKFYEDLSKNRPNYYSRRWEHRQAVNYISKNDFVLEVGSGFGSFLNLLKEKKIKSKGIELNPFAVEKCTIEGLHVEENLIQKEGIINKEKYDVVCSFQVLEHVTKVHEFIDFSLKTLKKEGKLIIGVPNNNPYLFINDKFHILNLPPHHSGLWGRESLESLEKIFPVTLEKLIFEPLEYNYFINSFIRNLKSSYIRYIIKVLNRFFPKILKKICCFFVKGRNVIAIYKKK